MKRIINGFEVDWASERVFAEQQTAPNYGYLFEVSADRKRIVRCAHTSAIGGDSDNLDGDAERLEKDARLAVEEFLGCQRESGGLLGGWWRRSQEGPAVASTNKYLAQINKSRGRGQTYLKDIGLTVMWEKQRTSTLLPPPQSEEAEFYPLCQLRP